MLQNNGEDSGNQPVGWTEGSTQSFGGYIRPKGLFGTMPDFIEIKIYHHTGYSSVWGEVKVVSSVHLCISTARIGNTWASVVEKNTETHPSVFPQGRVLFAVIYVSAVLKVWRALCKWAGRRGFGTERLWSPWAKITSGRRQHPQPRKSKYWPTICHWLPLCSF